MLLKKGNVVRVMSDEPVRFIFPANMYVKVLKKWGCERKDLGEYGACVSRTEIRSGILSNVKSEAVWGRGITRREKGTLKVGRVNP